MLEAILFDVDGTVAETEDLHRRAFNRAFRLHGLDLHWSAREYRRLLAVPGGKERIARALAERGAIRPAAEVAAVHATKTAFYEGLLAAEGAPWRPGVRRLMDEASREGLALGIATTTTDANLDPLFAPVLGRGWRSRFGAIVAGDQVARKKPDPGVYQEALRRLGVCAARSVAIEDSPAGVESARRAGCAVVAARSAWHPEADLSAAHLQLRDLGEFEAPLTFLHQVFRP